jgi:hypothetical protein
VFEGHRLFSTGSRWDIWSLSGGGKTRLFPNLAWRLWKCVLRPAARMITNAGRVVGREGVPVFEGHRLPSTGRRRKIRSVTSGGRTWYFAYSAWRIWKRAWRPAVTGNIIYGGIVRRQKVPVFERHRLPSTGSRWDVRWLSGRGKKRYYAY